MAITKAEARAKSRARVYEEERKLAEAKRAAKTWMYNTEFILPNNLKQLRAERFMSQTDLARKIGVCKSTVSMWENGSKGIKDKNKIELCRALRCDITTLFDWGI